MERPPIFAQPTEAGVRTRLDTVAEMLGKQFPKVEAMLLETSGLLSLGDQPVSPVLHDGGVWGGGARGVTALPVAVPRPSPHLFPGRAATASATRAHPSSAASARAAASARVR